MAVTIELGELKGEASSLMTFLGERLVQEVKVEDGEILIEDVEDGSSIKPQSVKTYIKRYLHNHGLRDKYRIFVEKSRLKIVSLKVEEEE